MKMNRVPLENHNLPIEPLMGFQLLKVHIDSKGEGELLGVEPKT
jgi:hypothetical protein